MICVSHPGTFSGQLYLGSPNNFVQDRCFHLNLTCNTGLSRYKTKKSVTVNFLLQKIFRENLKEAISFVTEIDFNPNLGGLFRVSF